MLKFEKILPVINTMIRKKAETERIKPDMISEAVEILKEIKPDFFVGNNIPEASYFIGTPLEEAGIRIEGKPFPDEYIAIATDGSAIAPDPDFAFYYYLINIGYVSIRYGAEHFFKADSIPQIFYEDKDLYEVIGENPYLIKGELLQAKMLLNESKVLSQKIEECLASKIPIIPLIDGTLIQWEIKGRDEEYKRHFIKSFESLFKKSEESGIPVAGYISGSHSKDVVGLIKYYLQTNGIPEEEIKKFDVLEDTDVFGKMLSYGERSAVFMSNVPILKYYSAPICFFYLNVGSEIARIEIPYFVVGNAKNGIFEEILPVQNLILSQAEKGMGYPIVLKEAHEQAVIKNGDKFTLENLLKEKLLERGIFFTGDAKLFFKKTRGI